MATRVPIDAEFPRFIEFQTISICNARCQVCPMEWTAHQLPQGRMSDALLDKLLSECREHAADIEGMEPYLNNEPFLDRRFLDILRRIRRDFHATVEISTNATLLTADLSAQIIAERLIDDFRFSVFGACRETYEKVMARLSWDVMCSNIAQYVELWQKAGRPIKSRIVFVDNPLLHPPGEAERAREFWAPSGLGVIVWRHLNRAGNNRILLDHGATAPSLNVIDCKQRYLRDRVAILYNGDVVLCCQDWARQIVIGNVARQTLAEVWSSPERRDYHARIYDPATIDPDLICLRCELARTVEIKGLARPSF